MHMIIYVITLNVIYLKLQVCYNLFSGPSGSVGTNKNPWHCGMCNFQCSTRSDVLDHTWSVHGLKSQYKCNLCSYRSSSKHGFDAHFASKHPTSTNVELIHVYRRVSNILSAPRQNHKSAKS